MRCPTLLWLTLSALTATVPAAAAIPALRAAVNAASYRADGLAPGSLGALFGDNLTGSSAVVLTINGQPAPTLYTGNSQINFQVPWATQPGPATLVLTVDGNSSAPLPVTIATAAPGLFGGTGAFLSAFSSAGPAHGGEYVTLYATGLGMVSGTPPATGAVPSETTLSPVLITPSATIGGQPATVAFAGLAIPGPNPYTIGVYEIDLLVPDGLTASDVTPVTVSMNGYTSNAITIPTATGRAASIARFTVLGPNGSLIARAITSESTCPSITIDGSTSPMQIRASATLPFYPVLSCDAAIPATAQAVTVEGQRLPMPVADPTRITVLGDTGCRMDATNSQACNDPAQWPLVQISASAAATNPQLLIHNGDFHYREVVCANAGCAGSPWGYNWAVWREDVFKPMATLLPVAPWILTRGNHEGCDRAGEGWFRFLEPRALPTSCQNYTDPYAIALGGLQFTELDSANADDAILYPDQIAAYSPQFAALTSLAGTNTWLLTHRPLWGIRSNLNANVVLQAASNNQLPAGVQLILSGHTHTFQTYTFSPARAPQLVIGNSGDNLTAPPKSVIGTTVGNATVIDTTGLAGFGFATMTPSSTSSWTITARDPSGQAVAVCQFQANAIHCP